MQKKNIPNQPSHWKTFLVKIGKVYKKWDDNSYLI